MDGVGVRASHFVIGHQSSTDSVSLQSGSLTVHQVSRDLYPALTACPLQSGSLTVHQSQVFKELLFNDRKPACREGEGGNLSPSSNRTTSVRADRAACVSRGADYTGECAPSKAKRDRVLS
ncbi:hypothetical protein BaRGS_00024838 [Batillaria attramentaria]|uniref:Uncharacterized protein n=1 Tax=Batillaria attramentaria TaxID=370345 RepID=A0ABD0K9Z7_9CAEN